MDSILVWKLYHQYLEQSLASILYALDMLDLQLVLKRSVGEFAHTNTTVAWRPVQVLGWDQAQY